MKINRAAHLPWLAFVLMATGAATLLYVATFHPLILPPRFRYFGEIAPAARSVGGTPLGLIFGSVSLGIFVFAALLGVRKKIPAWRIGHVQRWLRAHIWLTLLTVPLVLLHCGFRLGEPMTAMLLALYAIVMVSGIYGLALQNKLPTIMKERLPEEVVYEQIPQILAQLRAAAERLRESYTREFVGAAVTAAEPGDVEITNDPASEAVLARFLETQLLPFLSARNPRHHRLNHEREAAKTFSFLRLRVADAYLARIDEMQRWSETRRALALQVRLQHWLHGWLLVHVPISFLLLIMTAWHAYVTLFQY